MKKMNKKGIFFTSIALLMSAVLVMTFATRTSVTTKDQLPLTQAKANAVNIQARDLRADYLPQALTVSAYNSLYALALFLKEKSRQGRGDYIDFAEGKGTLFNATIKEMIINGTMCCDIASPPSCDGDLAADVNDPTKHIGVDNCIASLASPELISVIRQNNITKKLRDMENASFSAYRINTTFNTAYQDMKLELFQDNRTGPWQLGVNLSINYTIDAGGVMVNHSENITAIFTIEGIPDPLYAVESQRTALDGNTPFENSFNTSKNITNWNISTFFWELEGRLYAHEPKASSFLMRFYGNDEESPCCGIESIINPLAMSTVKGQVEKPYVDWCYYGRANRCTTAAMGGMWNVTCITTEADGSPFLNFAIDTYHATQYNLTGSDSRFDYLYGAGPPPACPELPPPPN